MTSTLTRALLNFAALCGFVSFVAVPARAQAGAPAAANGTVSGRVTVDDKPAANVAVMLTPAEMGPRVKALARARTDAEGRYTLARVPAGRYNVMPFAPAHLAADLADSWPPGKKVNVSEGEAIEGVDFKLERGGVITGRVTDADGRPVVNQNVNVELIEAPGTDRPRRTLPRPGTNLTDDRGVYRIYGLPEGRYRVYTGDDPDSGSISFSSGRPRYTRTFHPGVPEASQAKVVEVTAGGVAEDVDITLGEAAKTYKVAGRVVEAETGQPVGNVSIVFSPIRRGEQGLSGAFGGSGAASNARGEFQLGNVLPGRYGLFTAPGPLQQDERYAETTVVEVRDTDVSGVEIKLRRGASVSGVVVIEGTNDRAALAQLPRLQLAAHPVRRDEMSAPFLQPARVGADGSFRLAGLRPGKFRLSLAGWPPPKNFMLLRVERGGVEQREGVEVAEGEQVGGVRVVVGYGSGVVRGQVRFENGTPPAGLQLRVGLRKRDGDRVEQAGRGAEVDVNGRFLIEGVVPGAYEVVLHIFERGPRRVRPQEVSQPVTVGAGETTVTLTLDLSRAEN